MENLQPDDCHLFDEGRAFQMALGGLCLNWADVEFSLYRALLHYGQVSNAVGRATFSGMRAKPMRDAITAILENRAIEGPRKTDFKFISDHIGTVQSLRDLVVHYATPHWSVSPDVSPFRLVTDGWRIKRLANAKVFGISAAHLDLACADMHRIVCHLDRHLQDGDFRPFAEPKPSTWPYKQLQPIDPKTPPRKATHTQPPQRRP